MSSPSRSGWPASRRALVLLAVLIGGMSLYSLLFVRRGDFAAGLVPGIIGAALAATVVLVEVTGRWLARRRFRSADDQPSDEPAPVSRPLP